MNFRVQIDTKSCRQKPSRRDVQAMKPRLAEAAPQSVDISKFAELLLEGHSFTPGILQGGSKAEHWTAQQLFCLDIDNEDKTTAKGEAKRPAKEQVTADEVLRRCAEWNIKPALIYETFSSTPEWQKFRVVFVADTLIMDGGERDGLQNAIMALFPECDSACKNRDRLFYGGKSILYADENAVFTPSRLSSLIAALQAKQAPTVHERRNGSSSARLDTLKRDFDFIGYIRSFGGKERRAGKLIAFNPCPVCGHNDDFYFYPETNTFHCFSSSGNVGGSIIDFVMHTRNLDKKQAIAYFMHDLCGLSVPEEKAAFRKEQMLQKAENAGREVPGDLPSYIYTDIKSNGEIRFSVSTPLLAEYIRRNSRYVFVRNKATDAVRRYWYRGGVYALISDEELKGIIKKYITDYDITLLRMRDVNEVFQDLNSDCSFVSEEQLNTAEKLVNLQNGLLNIDTMELVPHNPDVLSTIQIPCNWNPERFHQQGCPTFAGYLQTLTGGDAQKQLLLLEYLGACLSNIHGSRFKKALFLVGQGNTGKSQFKALAEMLIGHDNTASIDLAELEKRFGTSKIYGKRLAGSSDMGYISIDELRIFKQLTGGDSIFAEFKCKPAFDFTYRGLLMFCTNELPKFGGDRGEWVYDRILLLRCDNVIPKERQDKFLLEKMYAEREAIVYWALSRFRAAYLNGCRFTIPDESRALLEEYKKANSPIVQFYTECCMERPEGRISDSCTTARMHEAFKAWCREHTGGYIPAVPLFKKEIAQYIRVDEGALTKKIHGNHYYIFTLTGEAKEIYRMYDSIPSA